MAVRDLVIEALVEAVAKIKQRVDRPIEAVVELTTEQLKLLVAEYFNAHPDLFKGEPGEAGRAGRAPTADEIGNAVDVWLELNSASLRGEPGQPGNPGKPGEPGKPGRDAVINESDLYRQATRWLELHRDELSGKPGENGKNGVDGVGIAAIRQTADNIIIELTNGQEEKIKLPKQAPLYIGSSRHGGGSSQREVFIDEQPVIDYPAVSFNQVASFPGLYLQSVNVS